MLALSVLVLSAASGALSTALAPRASAVVTDYYLPPYFCPAVAGANVRDEIFHNPLEDAYTELTCNYTNDKHCTFDLVRPTFH
jgi:hypothetical protein